MAGKNAEVATVADGAVVPGTLWIVSAPSGAGKTSLTQALVQRLRIDGFTAAISISYTTRPARHGEVDGEHYHFISAKKFLMMVVAGDFLEHAEVFGHHYGTGRGATRQQLGAGCQLFLDIDWQGARQLQEHSVDTRSIFIVPPSAQELERRLHGRGQDADSVIADRMRSAITEMSHYREYDFLLVNDDFERALDAMRAVVLAEGARTSVQSQRHASLLKALLD